jgi:O-antigen ligase
VVGTVIALALIPWATQWLVLGRPGRQAFLGGALILLGVSGLVGVWAGYDPNLSWPLFLTLLSSIALFFAIINIRISPWYISRGLVIVAAIFAFYFVSQYGHFDYPSEVGGLAGLGRAIGSLLPNLVFFTPHPNAAAGFVEGAVLLGLVLTWRAHAGWRIVWGLVVVLISYGLLISGSRGAWLGLTLSGAMWGLLLIPNRRVRLGVAGTGVALVVLAIFGVVWLTRSGWSMPGMDTLTTRLTLYHNSLYLWGDYPFTGLGLGDSFALAYSRYQLLIYVPFLYYAHNLLLSIGLGFGLLGLAALVWLFISFYHFVYQVEQTGLRPSFLNLFRAAWLGVTTTFLHGLIDSPQFAGSGWPMPMMLAGMGLVVAIGQTSFASRNNPGHGSPLSPSQLRIRMVAVGMLLAFLVSVAFFWQPLLGAWYANLGAIHQTRAELSPDLEDNTREIETQQAIVYFNQALKLNPAQPNAHWRLGLIALNRQDFEAAINHLEQAYRHRPRDQAILKALGFAYLWTGQVERAFELLQQRDDRAEVVEELGSWWSWSWAQQGREDLSGFAAEMAQRLAAVP